MKKLAAAALSFAALSLTPVIAAPFAPATAIGFLSFEPTGSPTDKIFFCSFALVKDPALEERDVPVAGLTAGHCLRDFVKKGIGHPYEQTHAIYASFDGKQFVEVEWLAVGDTGAGYDVALIAPVEGDKWPEKAAKAAYELAPEQERGFTAGEELETWGFPYGVGLSLARLYVTNPFSPRLFTDSGINWYGHPVVYGPFGPGASGSAVFDKNGRVKAVVVGMNRDGAAWMQGYLFPISKLFDLI